MLAARMNDPLVEWNDRLTDQTQQERLCLLPVEELFVTERTKQAA